MKTSDSRTLIPLAGVVFLATLLASCATASPPASPPAAPEAVAEDDAWTLLAKGETEKARDFFRGKMDVNTPDASGRLPLHRAAELADSDLASFFLSQGAKPDALDAGKRTALDISTEKKDAATTAVLCAAGADVFRSAPDGFSAAQRALNSGGALLNAVLTKDTVRAANQEGKTLLHLAALKGDLAAVTAILSAGAVVNQRDGGNKTALDTAFSRPDSYPHALVAEYLIKAGGSADNPTLSYLAPAVRAANFGVRFSDGLTPLHYAARAGHTGMVRLLIERKADVNAKDGSGTAPLHEAARTGNLEAMDLLIAAGAVLDARDAKGNAALHIVMPLETRKAGIDLLLSKGANPGIKDDHGDTPLHLAVTLNLGVEIAARLISGGTDVELRNTKGATPLHTAVATERVAYIQLLLDNGADIFAADTAGLTPFDLALQKGDAVQDAIITPKTVLESDNGGNTPLHIAVTASAPSATIARILDRKGLITTRNKLGDTALHLAVAQDEAEIGLVLLARGADVFATNARGESPLYLAAHADGGYREWMLNAFTLQAKDGLGNGVLHYAAQWRRDAVIPTIAEKAALLEARNVTGETPLFNAVRAGSPSTVSALVKTGASTSARDSLGNTALHAAVRWNTAACVQSLIQLGIDVDGPNLSGNTALHDAVRLGMKDIENLLLAAGADLEARDLEGNTPLLQAVAAGLSGSVERLLEKGADPTARNNRGDTPLHLAVILEKRDLITILLTRGASIHVRNAAGTSPLQMAMAPGLVSTLLTKDRLYSGNDLGQTALHIAVLERASRETIKTIIAQGAPLSAADAQGKTPLHLALESGAWETVSLLASGGADVFSTAADGETPGGQALVLGNEALKALFSGPAIVSRDRIGNTILHYAAYRGTPEQIQLLLELGADKMARNIAGESAQDLARRWDKRENSARLE